MEDGEVRSRMVPADFFGDDTPTSAWGPPARHLDTNLLETLGRGPIQGRSDLEAASALALLVRDDLESFGTGGVEQLSNQEVSLALHTLHGVLRRLGMDVDIPFRDFWTFKNHWVRQGAYGSWQARREILDAVFEPLLGRLRTAEDQALESTLAEPARPHGATGWPAVDERVRELRRRFRQASTPEDYRAVGGRCVDVLEALGHTVYDPGRHPREGETESDQTSRRLERYVEDAVPGQLDEEVRALAVRAIELARLVEQRETPTRRDAGIAADAAVLVASILGRLEQDA